jgi:putative molybdopterin biosynthesis protein
MEKEMLTVRELAAYLNLNEKIVYRLVREGKIPGTRVTGKWTFSRYLIRNWIESHSIEGFPDWQAPPRPSPSTDLFISGSDDLILDRVLSVILKAEAPDILAYFSNTGSMGGLKALRMGKAHLAGIHLYHPESGQYNMPFLRQHLARENILLYNLAYRTQGFIMRKTRGIKTISEIAEQGLRFINREAGSGTRHLLDLLCREEDISGAQIIGYENEVFTHLEVGLAILKGEADVGLGIQPVAELMDLDFLPLRKERYDLVVPAENLSLHPVQIFFNVIHSKKFRQLAKGLAGYDLRDSGKLISSEKQEITSPQVLPSEETGIQ